METIRHFSPVQSDLVQEERFGRVVVHHTRS